MTKRFLSILLAILMILSVVLTMSACSPDDGNYPVTVGQTTIKHKPEKVVVLSDSLADIIYYMGYSTQICAISDSCTQEILSKYIPSVGDESIPDTDAIIESDATLVLTDSPLSSVSKDKLSAEGIEVVNLMVPETLEQLTTVYTTLGKIFGGNTDGKKTGEDSVKRLLTTLEQAEKETEGSNIVKLVCYLYLDENNSLCSFSSTTCEGMILDYVSATNVASNFPDQKVEEDILRLSNPDFIFYDNENVLNYLHLNSSLSGMNALKNGNTYALPKSSLQRLGASLIETQNFMLSKMFPDSVSTIVGAESYAEDYGISFDENTRYENGSDHQDIKAIQLRLIDLGYLELSKDEVTTYFGSMSEEALESFQSANGIESTGVADYETLDVLFLSTTLSTLGQAVAPKKSNAPETTEPDSEPTEATTPQSSVNTNGYNIDLSSAKSYQAGDEHEDIKAIQERLEELLYLSFGEDDSYTSYFGSGTEGAIRNFQESNGLTATGVADYETLKLLFSDNAKEPQ